MMLKKLPVMVAIVLAAVAVMIPGLSGDDVQADPWSKAEILPPDALAKVLNSSGPQPAVICVAFPILYKQKHVLHAKFAGPTNKPEALKDLQELVKTLPKSSEIVIYCGCCPMQKCPNVRPAYRLLKDLGFTHIRVLEIPTNFQTDWLDKGYPVD